MELEEVLHGSCSISVFKPEISCFMSDQRLCGHALQKGQKNLMWPKLFFGCVFRLATKREEQPTSEPLLLKGEWCPLKRIATNLYSNWSSLSNFL